MNGTVILELVRIPREHAEAALESAAMDPAVGIRHAPIPWPEVESEGKQYQFHIAEVLPGKRVAPHSHPGDESHPDGDEEPYYFFGEGEMNLGSVLDDGWTQWTKSEVGNGSLIIVRRGEVHSFYNPGNKPVLFLFACPADHLGENRVAYQGKVLPWDPES